jgi:hypothetical protein
VGLKGMAILTLTPIHSTPSSQSIWLSFLLSIVDHCANELAFSTYYQGYQHEGAYGGHKTVDLRPDSLVIFSTEVGDWTTKTSYTSYPLCIYLVQVTNYDLLYYLFRPLKNLHIVLHNFKSGILRTVLPLKR